MFPTKPSIDQFRSLEVGEYTILQYSDDSSGQLGTRAEGCFRRTGFKFKQRTMILIDPKTLETIRILIITRTW